ncbi:MAG: HU family DNA-binding protein, partial [Duncaniella sp.]|nr:HU family DNA-binding protein [Duncaniella sp.]
MNAKIPFHQLSALLAEKCAITAAEAEDFVRGFFDLVTESLIEGDEVRIKGIGTFRRTVDPEQPVEFIPDATLADGINSPFAMFEPEVLSPEVTDTLLDAENEPSAETAGTTDAELIAEATVEETVEDAGVAVVDTRAAEEEAPATVEEAPVEEDEAPVAEEETPVIDDTIETVVEIPAPVEELVETVAE